MPSSYALAVPAGLAGNFSLPASMVNKPVASVLEGARLKGMATGVVVTSTTSHATPAGYTSHWYARSNEGIIMEQQAYAGLDVLMGGGGKHMTTARTDGENLLDTLRARGYRVVSRRDSLLALADTTPKVWAHFNQDAMGPDYDRTLPAYQTEPSISEMTDKAIKLLAANAKGQSKGFFLMVEGSQVDWASHANDPVGLMSEYLAFDAAVQKAVDYANSAGNTLVLVFSDHDNGGLSLGSTKTDATYSSLPYDSVFTANFKRASLTGVGMALQMGATPDNAAVIAAMNTYYGITDLTQTEIDSIKANCNTAELQYHIGPMLSKRCAIGWTTTGHAGQDVPLYYHGTADNFGLLENTDLAHICAKAMGFTLNAVNDSLFQEASALFTGNTSFTVDTTGVNSSRGALTVVLGGRTGVFPFNKNEAFINGVKQQMNGLTVYSYKNGKVYLPKMALPLLNGQIAVPPSLPKVGKAAARAIELYNVSGVKVGAVSAAGPTFDLGPLNLADGIYLYQVDGVVLGKISVANGSSSLLPLQ
jgi:alkaline phosphatase